MARSRSRSKSKKCKRGYTRISYVRNGKRITYCRKNAKKTSRKRSRKTSRKTSRPRTVYVYDQPETVYVRRLPSSRPAVRVRRLPPKQPRRYTTQRSYGKAPCPLHRSRAACPSRCMWTSNHPTIGSCLTR